MPKRAKSWTVAQRQFMQWLATPDIDKDDLTQGALAKRMGKAEATLSDWKKISGFTEAVNALTKSVMMTAYPAVVHALLREARRGNFPHMKLFFEMIGEYTPRQVIDVNVLAARISEETGTPISDIVAEAERILQQATADTGKGR